MNMAWWRQSSTEWASRVVMDLFDENKAWTTGWRPLRAQSDDDFREAVAKANELDATGDLSRNRSNQSPLPKTLSNLERCVALRLVYGAGPRWAQQKNDTASYVTVSLLSHVTVVPCVHVLSTSRTLPDSDRQSFFFFKKKTFIVAVAKHGQRVYATFSGVSRRSLTCVQFLTVFTKLETRTKESHMYATCSGVCRDTA